MRRFIPLGLAGCAALAVTGIAWHTRAAPDNGPAAGKPAAAESPLPIRQVVLFNSGVGYMQREGIVAGNAKVDLAFPASDINDLLKSLVLQDLGGGKVAAVSYDSHDPLDRILRSFAIDLNNNPTFGQILNQARGEKIEIQLVNSDKGIPAKINGSIVGVERKITPGKDARDIEKEMITLFAADSLQSIPLDSVVGVRFMNPVLEAEFQRALKVLASSHDLEKKSVTVSFDGAGQRAVRVGYVVERPIWKTTYRLRCEPNGKIGLQGWAIVDNTSDDDWNDVRMVLVSGRPISFRMNLYEPLFIPRPLVEPELFGSLRPVIYGGAMPSAPPGMAGVPGGALGGAVGGFGGGFGGNNANMAQGQTLNRLEQQQRAITFEELQNRKKALEEAKAQAKDKGAAIAMNFKEGIQSVASAEEVGDYFQYVVDKRISLSRQKSAMLPIIDQTIDGAKVSIFNESVHPKHPLLGLRLKNTSGMPLTQGPISVYDDSTYAGDTRILDLQPNEERLLSYALDQGTEVKSRTKSSPSPEMTFRIGQASMSALYKQRETRTYAIKNRSTHDRVLVIEHPIRNGWTLIEPAKPAERTRDVLRFEVKVAAGASANLDVVEDQPRTDAVALSGGQPQYVAGTGITVKEVVETHPQTLRSVQVVKGILTPTLKSRETRARYVQNLSDVDREFQIDHIVRPGWSLLLEKGEPIKGPAVHRATLKIAKGKSGELHVDEERIYQDAGKAALELPDGKLREYLNSPAVSDKVKAGLTKTLELNKRVGEAMKEVQDLDRQFKALSDDQARLRENLRIIPPTSDPYKKFLDKFVSQETEIEGLQRQIRAAQTSLQAAGRDRDAFLAAWTAE